MTTDGTQRATTILVVDDDPTTLLLASKPLQDYGYTVLTAPGSAEALRLYAEHPTPIHLVVTDIFLPPPVSNSPSRRIPTPGSMGPRWSTVSWREREISASFSCPALQDPTCNVAASSGRDCPS